MMLTPHLLRLSGGAVIDTRKPFDWRLVRKTLAQVAFCIAGAVPLGYAAFAGLRWWFDLP